MDRVFCYHIVLMLVATVAFLLLWIGFATPGWLVVTFQESEFEHEHTVSSLNRSLFYDIHCPQELKDCETCEAGDDSVDCVRRMGFVKYSSHIAWIEALTDDKEAWVAWRVLMVFVVILITIGFILVLCLVCCIFTVFTYKVIAVIAFILWLIGCLLAWITVGMVADMHIDIEDTVDDNIAHDATLHAPYSLIIVAVGALLAFITALLLLFLAGCCSSKRRREKYSDTASSGQIIVVPREHRYYGPQPYYIPERPVQYYREPSEYIRNEGYVVEREPPISWTNNPYYDNKVY